MFLCFLMILSAFSSLHAWVFSVREDDSDGLSVCYDDLGCFSGHFPFDNAGGVLPLSPEDIGVVLYRYSADPEHEGNFFKTPISMDDPGLPDLLNTTQSLSVVIHGYNEDSNRPHLLDLLGELVLLGTLNVVIVDWGEGAHGLYGQCVANTRVVGAVVSRFLTRLFNITDVGPDSVHLIGYSLGAHVAGYVGTAIPGLSRITALDPAGPMFKGTSPEVRLDPSDAQFVDTIHTNGDPLLQLGFGMDTPVGHADFYPNGGMRQPGCGDNWDRFVSLITGRVRDLACSHRRSVELFTESVNSPCLFLSAPCSFDDISENYCVSSGGASFVAMGYHLNETVEGTFFLTTESARPYCKD